MKSDSGHGKGVGRWYHVASLFALLGLSLALLAALVAVGSGIGNNWHWWNFRSGFLILRGATYLGLIAGLFSALGLLAGWRAGAGRSLLISLAGLVVSALVVWVPWSRSTVAKRVPPIHDISTDTANPPQFSAILPLRKGAPNTSEYGGPGLARLQHEAYPDIGPIILPVSTQKAFEGALAAVRKMGWQIVDANRAEGRIEAVATTIWFHFKDDVVIRIMGGDRQSRVDVRSVSRVGRSDLGTNARRIRTYARVLRKACD